MIDGWSLGLKLLVPCSEHGMVGSANFAGQTGLRA